MLAGLSPLLQGTYHSWISLPLLQRPFGRTASLRSEDNKSRVLSSMKEAICLYSAERIHKWIELTCSPCFSVFFSASCNSCLNLAHWTKQTNKPTSISGWEALQVTCFAAYSPGGDWSRPRPLCITADLCLWRHFRWSAFITMVVCTSVKVTIRFHLEWKCSVFLVHNLSRDRCIELYYQ